MSDPVRGGPPAPDAPTREAEAIVVLNERMAEWRDGKCDGPMVGRAVKRLVDASRAVGYAEGRALAAGTPQPTATGTPIPADQRQAILDIIAEHGCFCDGADGCAGTCWGARIEAALRAVPPPPDTAARCPKCYGTKRLDSNDGGWQDCYVCAPAVAAAPTTADRHGFWTLNCEGDSEGGRYHLRGDFGRDRDGTWAAYERLLRAPAPATADAPTDTELRAFAALNRNALAALYAYQRAALQDALAKVQAIRDGIAGRDFDDLSQAGSAEWVMEAAVEELHGLVLTADRDVLDAGGTTALDAGQLAYMRQLGDVPSTPAEIRRWLGADAARRAGAPTPTED